MPFSTSQETSVHYSAISFILTLLGLQDKNSKITQSNEEDRVLANKLQTDYAEYLASSDFSSVHNLETTLAAVIEKLMKNRVTATRLAKEANDRLSQEALDYANRGMTGFWGGLTVKSKSLVGSDDVMLAKHYEQLAAKYSAQLQELSNLRDGLQWTHAQTAKEMVESPNTRRHLLQTANGSLPITPEQFCFPNGTCNLGVLSDGFSGFLLQGGENNEGSGAKVSIIEDVNGDEIPDILVGGPNALSKRGKSYVVFGTRNNTAWGNGRWNLSSLMNGQSGFVLEGEAANDYSGSRVSTAGDINGDGVFDILVGAYGALSNTGKTYVVFGSRNSSTWSGGLLNVSSLMDGQHGFVLQGEAVNDYNGNSVSTAGDINGDGISDILVGANGALSNRGKTYVVFGNRNSSAWGGGLLNLSSLMDGQHGFVLQGEAPYDNSGFSVSTAGDINGDGVSDIIIGAPNALTQRGKNYVVFGTANKTAWGNGVWNLSSLIDGQRGFVLQGEASNDNSGYSVSTAGDMNGDGISDIIIGAPKALSIAGKTYVVFGTANRTAWGNGVWNLSSLMDGQRGFALQGEASSNSGVSVNVAGDVNGDGVSDILVGAQSILSYTGKTYVIFGTGNSTAWSGGIWNLSSLIDGQRGFVLQGEVSASDSGLSSAAGDVNDDGLSDIIVGAPAPNILSGAGRSYVVFGAGNCQLWNAQLIVYRGTSTQLSRQNLNATCSGSVQFNVAEISRGQFEYLSKPGQPITVFDQADVWAGKVQFTHDGGPIIPTCTLQIPRSRIATVFLIQFNITYFANQLVIHQGELLQMNGTYLNANSNYSSDQVNISITHLQHGMFILKPFNNSVMQFNLAQWLGGQIVFVHDNTRTAPSYNASINDPTNTLLPSNPAYVTFYRRPLWITNQLTLVQGNTLMLSAKQINITEDVAPNLVVFTVNGIQHGQFMLAATNVSTFNKQQLLAGQVSFSHDGSAMAPSYQLVVSDGYFTLAPQAALINFSSIPPKLMNNNLTVFQGLSQTLTSANLSAVDPDPSFNSSQLLFILSNVQHGQFLFKGSTTNVMQFTQDQVNQGQVEFAHDGTAVAPGFFVTCSNSYQNTTATAANIFFDKHPVIINNRLTVNVGESVVMALTNLQAVDDHTSSDNLLFTIESINHGHFSALQAPGVGILSFIQQQVRDSEIQFIHDGSSNAPNYIVKVTDGSGLNSTSNARVNFIMPQAVTGINYQELYSALSSIGGIIVTIVAFLWIRRRISLHRHEFPFANDLRDVLNLEYYDFNRFQGDAYKTKINNFLERLNLNYKEFYTKLTSAEQKSFAVCVGEILLARNLVFRSNYGAGLFGILCFLNVGWPSQLNLKAFEMQSSDIAAEAIATWKHYEGYELRPISDLEQDKPTENNTIYVDIKNNVINYKVIDKDVNRGGEQGTITATEIGIAALPATVEELKPYLAKILEITLERGHTQSDRSIYSPTKIEKLKALCCCAKPSRVGIFAPKKRFIPGVELEALKKYETEGPTLRPNSGTEQKMSSNFENSVLSFMGEMREEMTTINKKIDALEGRPLLVPDEMSMNI